MEQPSVFLAPSTDDRDVDTVRFEYRALGSSSFQLLSLDAEEPWEALWSTEALPFDDYELRAVATDEAGNSDPSPAAVVVTLTDLTPPDAPQPRASRWMRTR